MYEVEAIWWLKYCRTKSASSSLDVGAILLGQELHLVGKLALDQELAHLLRVLAS